jgi:hypothetical protein
MNPKPHYLYKITVGEKSYIGVSKNVRDRLSHHCLLPTLLGAAIRLHGRDAMSFLVLACGQRGYIYELEGQAIDAFNTRWPNGYNLAAGGWGGRDPLPSTIVKLAAAASKTFKGRKQSPEHIANRVAARFKNGKKFTPEQRARMSAAQKGKKLPPEQIVKMVATRKANGYKHSEETKAKIGAANKLTMQKPEVQARLSTSSKARWADSEIRNRTVAAMAGRDMSRLIELSADLRRGVPLSEEHRANISKAQKCRATAAAMAELE